MTMTVSDSVPLRQYTASVAQTAFSVPFEFRQNSDIKVRVNGALKTLGADYTLIGAGVSGGGTCTFLVAMTGGEFVVIYGDMPVERGTEQYATYGPLPGEVLEADLDNMTMRTKQLARDISRAIHLLPYDTSPASSFELPMPTTRANKIMRFNSSGNLEMAVSIGATTLSRSVIGGFLYLQTVAEVAAGVTPVDYGFPTINFPRYGTVGDGISDDVTAANKAIDVAEGSLRLVTGQPGDIYKLTGTLTPSGTLLMDLLGSTLKASAAVNVLTPKVRLDLLHGKFDTFLTGISNANSADPTLDLMVTDVEFTNSSGLPINVECPSRYFSVVACRFFTNDGYQVRHGKNDLTLQPGWKSSLVALNYFDSIDAPTANTVAAIISYAPSARVIGNYARDINGLTGQDTTFIYVKSKRAIVALNACELIESTGTPILYGINLKGDDRAGASATPLGFGATAALNSLLGQDQGVGIQLQVDEQAAIGNYIDSFKCGFELGSGVTSYGMLALNRAHAFHGLTDSRGITASIDGEMVLDASNIFRGFGAAHLFTVPTAKTFFGLSIVNSLNKGQGNTIGTGIQASGTDADSLTGVLISGGIVKSFNQGVNLTKVKGALIDAMTFNDLLDNTRPYYLSACKNIRAVQSFNTTKQTTDATATTVFTLGDLADGNVLKVTMHALAAKSDMSAVGSLRRDFIFKRTGGTTTLVASGTQVNDGGSALPADALSAAVSTDKGLFKVKGIAAETWNWTVNFDFELH